MVAAASSVANYAPLGAWEGVSVVCDPSKRDESLARLLGRLHDAMRLRHLSRRTEEAYVGWIRRFIAFHDGRHPVSMGAAEVSAFLSFLARDRDVAPSTQNQALSALLFLYRDVLGGDLPWLDDMVRARVRRRLPVVMTREEVAAVLGHLDPDVRLVCTLLYGAGLRVLEGLRLRVKDVDFSACRMYIYSGEGDKDRPAVLPATVVGNLREHLAAVRHQHAADVADGARATRSGPAKRARGGFEPEVEEESWETEIGRPASRPNTRYRNVTNPTYIVRGRGFVQDRQDDGSDS